MPTVISTISTQKAGSEPPQNTSVVMRNKHDSKDSSPTLSTGSPGSKRLSGDFSIASSRLSGDMEEILDKLSSKQEESSHQRGTSPAHLIPETVAHVSETRAKVQDLLEKRKDKGGSEERGLGDDGLKLKLESFRKQKYQARKSEFLSAAGLTRSKTMDEEDIRESSPKEVSPKIQEQLSKIQEQLPHVHKQKSGADHSQLIVSKSQDDLALSKTTPVIQEMPVNKSRSEVLRILTKSPETNLDELLMQNVDYLSDRDLARKVEKSGKKPSEKGKTKRTLKKKHMRRSHSDSSGMNEIALAKR